MTETEQCLGVKVPHAAHVADPIQSPAYAQLCHFDARALVLCLPCMLVPCHTACKQT